MDSSDNTRVFLNINGVPSQDKPFSERFFFRRNATGEFESSVGKRFHDIDEKCVRIHAELAARIFGSQENYQTTMKDSPIFLVQAGLNSECPMSRAQFEGIISMLQSKSAENTNRVLYFCDCEKLLSGIQDGSKEVIQILGEFYRTLNLEPLFYPEGIFPDGTRFVSSPTVSKLTAFLNFIYIRLHSLLDYSTKLAFEAENLRKDFSRYPRMASRGKLYGNKRKLKLNGYADTLFEANRFLREIELTRDHIVHDGFLDEFPKVYEERRNGRVIERFMLFPDIGERGWEKSNNRNLFYSHEDKITLRLPELVDNFQYRQSQTLQAILGELQPGILEG